MSSDRFVSETLMASMPVQGGFEGQPEERTAEVSSRDFLSKGSSMTSK